MKHYHLTTAAAWREAQARGEYRAPSLASEGFIHLSFAHQWRLTQQRYYRDATDLVRLEVHGAEPMRVENGFPHLYGPLPVSAVVDVQPVTPLRDLRVALYSVLEPEKLPAADLVVLPEMPFNDWFPETKEENQANQDGGRLARQAALARSQKCALLGGALVGRANLALLWDAEGVERMRYQKMHLPQEPGFWEASHTDPGSEPPGVCDALGFPLGVQICSDIHRPFGATFLAAQGAAAILVPRATEKGTFPRWRRVFQAMARITACYILSVNRPGWGPSLAVGPDGEVLVESDDPTLTVELKHEAIVQARSDYPGYLPYPSDVYARAWGSL